MKIPSKISHPIRLKEQPSLHAFTLIEMLTVVAVIGLLSALLLPAVQNAKSRSAAAKSISNLRQIGAGMNMFAAENDGSFPPAAAQIKNEQGQWSFLGSWDAFIMPYLGADVPVNFPYSDSGVKKEKIRPLAPLISHPNDRSEIPPGAFRRSYAMSTVSGAIGKSTWSGTQVVLSARQVNVIEPANTILVLEKPGFKDNTLGRTGGAGTGRASDQLANQPKLNPDGRFNYLFADGHVGTYAVEDTIGKNGTLDAPQGFWTINPLD